MSAESGRRNETQTAIKFYSPDRKKERKKEGELSGIIRSVVQPGGAHMMVSRSRWRRQKKKKPLHAELYGGKPERTPVVFKRSIFMKKLIGRCVPC